MTNELTTQKYTGERDKLRDLFRSDDDGLLDVGIVPVNNDVGERGIKENFYFCSNPSCAIYWKEADISLRNLVTIAGTRKDITSLVKKLSTYGINLKKKKSRFEK